MLEQLQRVVALFGLGLGLGLVLGLGLGWS